LLNGFEILERRVGRRPFDSGAPPSGRTVFKEIEMKYPEVIMKRLTLLAIALFCAGVNLGAQTNNQKILIAYLSLHENIAANTNADASTSASIVVQGNERVGGQRNLSQK
jgi:hypothetical protein